MHLTDDLPHALDVPPRTPLAHTLALDTRTPLALDTHVIHFAINQRTHINVTNQWTFPSTNQ
jgi:hypothetical protein